MSIMTSPLIGQRGVDPGTGTVYCSINNSDNAAWDATETNVHQMFPFAATLTGLSVKLETAPGGVASRTYTVMKNGVATALTVTITGASTTASDTTTQVFFSAGDFISLQASSSGSPTAANRTSWYSLITGAGQPLMLLVNATSSTNQQPLSGAMNVGNTIGVRWPTSGSISNAMLSVAAAPGVGKTFGYTLWKNGVATNLSIILSGSQTSGTDSTHTIPVSAGDLLYWKQSASNSPASTRANISCVHVPGVNGQSVIQSCFISSRTPSVSATNYNGVNAGGVWTTVEAQRASYWPACILSRFYVNYSADPAGTAQWVNTLRKNASNTSITVTVASGSTTGQDTSNSVTLVNNDSVTISSVPTNTPASAYVEFTLVAFIDPGTTSFRFISGHKGGRTTANNTENLAYYGVIGQGYVLSDSSVANTFSAGATQITTRAYHIASYACDFVKSVYSIFRGSGRIGDVAMPNSVTISGGIQRGSLVGPSDQSGQVVPFTFSNAPSFSGTHTYSISESVPFPLRTRERFWTRNCVTVANTTDSVTAGFTTEASNQQLNTGDGISAGNLVSSGTINLSNTTAYGYAPILLGYFPDGNKPPSCCVLGDSIGAGTGDIGFWDGYARIPAKQTNLNSVVTTINPIAPFVNFSRGGEFASDWVSNHVVQLPVGGLFSTWLCQFGTHDIGTTVAGTVSTSGSSVNVVGVGTSFTTLYSVGDFFYSLNGSGVIASITDNTHLSLETPANIPAGTAINIAPTNIIRIVDLGITQNIRRFIQCTLIPKMDSTDGWMTIAGQTPGANYVERYKFNDWVRDTSSQGFVAIANARPGAPADLARYFDAAFAVTVDANNQPTTGPGYWGVPTANAPYADYTVANGTGLTVFSQRLTPPTIQPNQDIGWVVVYLNGPAAFGPQSIIWSQQTDSNTTHNIKPGALNAVPNIGDTCRIYSTTDAVLTIDSTHGTSACYAKIAAAFDASLII